MLWLVRLLHRLYIVISKYLIYFTHFKFKLSTEMKSIIFKLAHFLRTFKLSLSQALKMAWSLVTRKPTVEVIFRKEEPETVRTATATITSIAVNKAGELYARFTEVVAGVTQPRSFNFSRLISIQF